MAMVATAALVDLLPYDIGSWVTERARIEGVAPDALVLVMLRDYRRIVESASRVRFEDPVPLVACVSAVVAIVDRMVITNAHKPELTTLGEDDESMEDSVLAVLNQAPTPTGAIAIRVRARRQTAVHLGSLMSTLSKLYVAGRIARVGRGVYTKAT